MKIAEFKLKVPGLLCSWIPDKLLKMVLTRTENPLSGAVCRHPRPMQMREFSDYA
jgi:hypothetical protein